MYVKRDLTGAVVAVSRDAEAGFDHLSDDHPELRAFLKALQAEVPNNLQESDLEMARVMEDLIYLLVERGTILFTDLPQPAQAKLLARREMREKVRGVDLLGDEDEGLGL